MIPNGIQLAGVLDRIYSASDRDSFISAAVSGSAALFPDTLVAWHDVDLRYPRTNVHDSNRPEVATRMGTRWSLLASESPVVRFFLAGGRGSVTRTTDLISRRVLERSRFFQESWRPFGVTDQIGIGKRVGSRVLGLSIKRAAAFRRQEVELLQSLAPHVLRAWSRSYGISALGPGALTCREREVLKWICEGKRDSEIGCILNISPRTVGKHIEHILAKLGVETRGAAAACLNQGLVTFTKAGRTGRVLA